MKKIIITVLAAVLAIASPVHALTAEEYAKQAEDKIEAKDYRGAAKSYTEAIKLDPKNADYYYKKAEVEIRNLKEYKQAESDIDKALAIEPNNSDYRTLKVLSAEAYAHPKAFESFLKAAEEFDNKNYTAAMADINNAIKASPNFALYYAVRGFAKASNNEDPVNVLADYDIAISLDKESMKNEIISSRNTVLEAWNYKIQEGLDKKDYNASLLEVTKLIDLAPDYIEFYITRAMVFQNLKQFNNAISDIDKAISLNPGKVVEYEGYKFVIKEAKAHPEAYQLFVSAREKLIKKDYSGSLADSTQAIKLSPSFGDYYVIRALAKKQLKDYKGALSDMDKAASVDPDNKTKFLNRENIAKGIKKAMESK